MTTTEPTLPPPPSGPPLRVGPEMQSLLVLRDEEPNITGTELAGVLGAGLAGNYALRTGISSIAGTLTILAIGAVLLIGGRVERRESRIVIAAAMALSPWLALRTSDGLTMVTLLAIVGLFSIAVGYSRHGRIIGAGVIAMLAQVLSQMHEWAYGIAMVHRFVRTRGRIEQALPLLRGVAVAIPIVALFAILLASADDVFKSVISVDGLPSVLGHLALAALVAVAVLGLVSRAAHPTQPTSLRLGRVLKPIEVNVILGSVAVLFAAFVLTQVAVAAGGVDHVLETAGLTQAEHARSGFFQLLWVAALALALIGGVRAIRRTSEETTTRTSPDRFRPLSIAILALTLVITAISIQRLLLYVDAFGLTPLRFWSLTTAGWIGVLLVAYAIAIARPGRGSDRDGEQGPGVPTSWFPAFVVISAAVLVFGLNAVNPDGFVTSHNIDHVEGSGTDAEGLFARDGVLTDSSVDYVALGQLSSDNVRTIESALDGLSSADREHLIGQVCNRPVPKQHFGYLGWNWADVSAREFVSEFCRVDRA